MAQIFASIKKYIQGDGELSRIKKHLSGLDDSVFVLGSQRGLTDLKEIIENSFKDTNTSLEFEPINGTACCKQEVERLRERVKGNTYSVIVGMGGGTVIDTAKALAYYEQVPLVVVPTVASCDAPTSQLVVYYDENGQVNGYLPTRRNPDMVLVDTRVIANSPTRLLVAGMGDALSTFFEARTCIEVHRKNFAGGTFTQTSYALAKLCYEILLTDGRSAKLAADNKVVTKSLNNIVEANILLSGLGFESNGVSAAHAIHDGFMVLPGAHDKYHGEWVAFGTIALLVLENRPMEEIDEVINFCWEVGLPTTLEDLGLKDITREDLFKVAQVASAPNTTIHNEPFPVTADDVLAAILVADSIGQRYRKGL